MTASPKVLGAGLTSGASSAAGDHVGSPAAPSTGTRTPACSVPVAAGGVPATPPAAPHKLQSPQVVQPARDDGAGDGLPAGGDSLEAASISGRVRYGTTEATGRVEQDGVALAAVPALPAAPHADTVAVARTIVAEGAYSVGGYGVGRLARRLAVALVALAGDDQ